MLELNPVHNVILQGIYLATAMYVQRNDDAHWTKSKTMFCLPSDVADIGFLTLYLLMDTSE